MRPVPRRNILKVVLWSVSALVLADLYVYLYALLLDEAGMTKLVRYTSFHLINGAYYLSLAFLFYGYLSGLGRGGKTGPRAAALAVHFPAFASLVLLTMIVLGTFIALAYLAEIPPESELRKQFWEMNILSGIFSLVYCFYVCEFAARRWLYPWVLEGRTILDLPGVLENPIRWRILEFFLFTAVIPILLVCYKVYLYVAGLGVTPAEIYFLTGAFVLSGIAMTFLLSQGIARPLGEMSRSTQKISGGDFSVSIPVQSKDEVGRLAASFNAMTAGLQERDFIRETFGRYVDKEVARRILQEQPKLGGERKVATFLMLDVVGFTALSEKLQASQVVDLLNQIFSRSVEAIHRAKGVCDKFIGDGLLATFGLLEADPQPQRRAVDAALHILEAMGEINKDNAAAGRPEVKLGIGIHCGEVIAGNIGAQSRMQYTVIGDPVNVTSRIEHLTRELGVPILISEAVQREIHSHIPCLSLGEHAIRGRTHKIGLYSPQKGSDLF